MPLTRVCSAATLGEKSATGHALPLRFTAVAERAVYMSCDLQRRWAVGRTSPALPWKFLLDLDGMC